MEKRIGAYICFLALLCAGAYSDTTQPGAKFDVADVHSSPHTVQPFVRGPFFSTGRYELRYATMVDLIRTAYDIEPEKISGGPSWLEMDRFDVFAKMPEHSTAESRRLMLQSLLVERFNLKIHNDSRPMAAYALTVGKHPEMKESDGAGETGCNFNVPNPPPPGPPQPGTPIQLPVIVYTCRNTSMASLAAGMLNFAGAGQYFNNTLVVDKTDLKGNWDFSFRFTPKVPAGIAVTGESIPLFDAMEKQLGLKLELTNVPMPVIVVDGVNRKPSENSPEAMKSFPPLPTEFEVASLKPSDPNPGGGRGAPSRPDIKNGRLFLPQFSLKNLIMIAWDLNTDERLANAPKWLDDDKYDILAKAPAIVAIGDLTPNRNTVPVNIDALRPMLRALVAERFQMKSHMEERPLNAYNLVAVKPKLKQADPNSRTRWQEGALPDSKNNKNANTQLGRLVNCQNVTMAEFAQLLPGIAPGYLHTEVSDATGLEGGFDFTFSFSPIGLLNRGRQSGGGGGDANADTADPSGAVSLFDAVAKQLGLKLELQKRPTQVLVIDSIERKPIEN
jgi:uncharacterized protein (TIGR03435 family)